MPENVGQNAEMISTSSVLLLGLLAAAVQSVAPDRWIPLSVHAW